MPILLRRLHGPAPRREMKTSIEWTFFGTNSVDKANRWVLRYNAETRQFSTSNVTKRDDRKAISRYLEFDIKSEAKNVKGRTVADALRSRLSRDDIAACTRKSLTLGATP